MTASNPTTVLRLTGKDVLGLLHRISTQSLTDLGVGEARATLFCDFRARLLHRAWVVRMADESVWLLRDDAPGDTLAAHIDKHVFREDVKLENLGAELSVRGRLGAELAPGPVGARELSPGKVGTVPGLVGIGPGAALEVVAATSAALSPAEATAWELARIEAGRPRHGHEITDTFHPYEIGLWDDVHLSKGCYTGQEVLQRLITYDSVRRQLVRVGGSGTAPSVPAALCAGEERVGTLTSASANARGGWIGLAVLGKVTQAADARIRVEDGAELTALADFPGGQPRGRESPRA